MKEIDIVFIVLLLWWGGIVFIVFYTRWRSAKHSKVSCTLCIYNDAHNTTLSYTTMKEYHCFNCHQYFERKES